MLEFSRDAQFLNSKRGTPPKFMPTLTNYPRSIRAGIKPVRYEVVTHSDFSRCSLVAAGGILPRLATCFQSCYAFLRARTPPAQEVKMISGKGNASRLPRAFIATLSHL